MQVLQTLIFTCNNEPKKKFPDVKGITVLYILVSILANYIYILNYLLRHLLSRTNFLILLLLFLGVLLLYFPPLLGLFRALKYLPPIILTML
jgi:hypothetical protein